MHTAGDRGDGWNHCSHQTTNSSAVIKDAVVYSFAHLCFTCVTCTYSVCCCRYSTPASLSLMSTETIYNINNVNEKVEDKLSRCESTEKLGNNSCYPTTTTRTDVKTKLGLTSYLWSQSALADCESVVVHWADNDSFWSLKFTLSFTNMWSLWYDQCGQTETRTMHVYVDCETPQAEFHFL